MPTGEAETKPEVPATKPSSSSRAIPEGMRVVAIRPIYEDVIAILQPGDVVDVLTLLPDAPLADHLATVVRGLTVFDVDLIHKQNPIVSVLVNPDQAPLLLNGDKNLRIKLVARKDGSTSRNAESVDSAESPTREVPVVVTNSAEELQQLTPGERVNVLKVTRPPLAASLGAVSEQIVVADAKLVAVQLGDERVAILELTAQQAGDVLQSGERPLTIQAVRPQASGTDSTWRNRVETAPSSAGESTASLHSDIRALHDDVRKLISLLEQHLDHQHPGHDSSHGDAPHDAPVPADAAPRTPAATPEFPADAEPAAEEAPEDDPSLTDHRSGAVRDLFWDQLGLRVSRLGSDDRLLAGQPYHGGLLIEDVRPDSPMAGSGARKGDVFVGFGLWELLSEENLQYVLNRHSTQQDEPIKFYLLRNRETVYGHVHIERQPDATNTTPAAPSAGAIIQREFADAAPLAPDSAATPSRPDSDFINNWGRAMLRGQFRIAMGIVHDAYRADPDNPLYEQYVRQTRTAFAAGTCKQPLTVAVLADWCGPCRQMQPLLRRLQDTTGDIIVLDADIDRDLVERFEIDAVPSFARVIDGEKQDEIIGVASEDALRRFMQQSDDPPPDQPQTHRPDLRLFPVEGFTIHVPAAGAIRRGVTDAFPAFESSKTDRVFSFYVGFTR